MTHCKTVTLCHSVLTCSLDGTIRCNCRIIKPPPTHTHARTHIHTHNPHHRCAPCRVPLRARRRVTRDNSPRIWSLDFENIAMFSAHVDGVTCMVPAPCISSFKTGFPLCLMRVWPSGCRRKRCSRQRQNHHHCWMGLHGARSSPLCSLRDKL